MRYVLRRVAGLSLALTVLAGTGAAVAAEPTLRVLSNRADLISGGDALVQVAAPAGVDPASIRVDVDGRDVTGAFALRPDGRYLGLLEGLKDGDNVLTARAPGKGGTRITITNHPIGGPVTSGPQIQPWKCFEGAQDKQCNRPPEYEFFYQS